MITTRKRRILLSAIALIAVSVGVAYGWQAILQLTTVDRAPAMVMSDAPTVPLTVGANDGGTFLYRIANQVRLNQNFIANVQHYSATGDGTTDDTTNLQAAIDDVISQGGGTVFVPTGTYLVSASLNLDDDVTLVGEGRSSVIVTATNDEIINATDAARIVIRDLSLRGDGDTAKTAQRGVYFTNVTDSLVENVHVKDVGYDGILLISGCVGNTIANCHCDGCGDDGINIGGDPVAASTDNTVVGNVVENGNHDGIHISDGSLRTTATGNTIYSCDNGISFYKTHGNTVSGNTIYDCGNGFYTPSGPNTDLTLASNSIDSCTRGIYLTNGTSRYIAASNLIRNCTDYGILISENPAASVDAALVGNNISGGCSINGIHLTGAKNCLVQGNEIASVTGNGIYARSVTTVACSAVSILGNHLRAIGAVGILVESGTLSDHITIRANVLRDNTTRCIEYRGGPYWDISENRCIDSGDFTILISATAIGPGFGLAEGNKVIGGGSTEGIRINNYNDVIARNNVVTGITSTTGINVPAGYRVLLGDTNLSDKAISGGVQTRITLFDHFLGSTLNSNLWTVAKGSDAECANFAVLADQVRGIIRATTGNDAANSMAVNGVQINSALNWRANQGGVVMEFRVSLGSISNEAIFIGLTDQAAALEMPFTYSGTTLTSNATDAVGILFDTDADTDNWKLVGVAADTDATVQDAAVAPSAGVAVTWRIELSPTGSAQFYRNGAAIGTVMTGAVGSSVLLTPVVAGFSHTTASKTFDVDSLRVDSN